MVILYLYLKNNAGNITGCIPFRYNIEEDNVISSREVILDIDDSDDVNSIRGRVVQMLDKEKVEYGKQVTDDFTRDLSNVVTVQ